MMGVENVRDSMPIGKTGGGEPIKMDPTIANFLGTMSGELSSLSTELSANNETKEMGVTPEIERQMLAGERADSPGRQRYRETIDGLINKAFTGAASNDRQLSAVAYGEVFGDSNQEPVTGKSVLYHSPDSALWEALSEEGVPTKVRQARDTYEPDAWPEDIDEDFKMFDGGA
jgi:hypothetical protein